LVIFILYLKPRPFDLKREILGLGYFCFALDISIVLVLFCLVVCGIFVVLVATVHVVLSVVCCFFHFSPALSISSFHWSFAVERLIFFSKDPICDVS
jgi:uncharacterized membrane protein